MDRQNPRNSSLFLCALTRLVQGAERSALHTACNNGRRHESAVIFAQRFTVREKIEHQHARWEIRGVMLGQDSGRCKPAITGSLFLPVRDRRGIPLPDLLNEVARLGAAQNAKRSITMRRICDRQIAIDNRLV